MFVEATVVFVIMQMSLGLILNVIVGFSVVDGRWRGREAILDLDFTISHRCKCQFCQKRFSLRVLALRRVCKQMTTVAIRPCCTTGAKVVLRRSTTLTRSKALGSKATPHIAYNIHWVIVFCRLIDAEKLGPIGSSPEFPSCPKFGPAHVGRRKRGRVPRNVTYIIE